MTYLNGMTQLQLDRILRPFQVPTMGSSSPISRYSGEVVASEEVPGGWWGSWVGQFAAEALLGGVREDS